MTVLEWAKQELKHQMVIYGFDPEEPSSQLFQLHKAHGEHVPLECYFQAYGRAQAYMRLIRNLETGTILP